MLQAFVLSILTLTHVIQTWHIIFLSFFSGLINAFDMPTRQTFVIDLIEDKSDLSNAIALNSSMFNVARLVGPTVAGFLIYSLGEGLCFLVNAISYIAVIIALSLMNIKPNIQQIKKDKILKGLREGIKYAYEVKPIRALLLLIGLVSLTGMPYTVLLPVFARDVLHGNANTFGFLLGAAGIGALTGALYLASRKSVLGLGRWVSNAAFIFAIGLVLFSFSKNIILSMSLMVFMGFGMMIQTASTNTMLQTLVEDSKRGRIMSLYVIAFMGTAPFGSFAAGSLASTIGASYTVLTGGIICLIGAIIFAIILPTLKKYIKPIYVKMGIIPEASDGL